MGIYTFSKTPSNSHYSKINGIQWDYFNGTQLKNLPREIAPNFSLSFPTLHYVSGHPFKYWRRTATLDFADRYALTMQLPASVAVI